MDAPPGLDAAHSSGDDFLISPPFLAPPPQHPSVKALANGTEQMAAHQRILALNKAWKERRARQLRDGGASEDGDSSSDTDSEEPSEADPLVAAPAMPKLRPEVRLQAAASPVPLPTTACKTLPAKAPCVSITRVPLPDFPRPRISAKPNCAPSPGSAVKRAAVGPATTRLSSTSSSSLSSSFALVAPTVQRIGAENAAKQSVLQFPKLVQAESTTSKPPDKPGILFPTPGELVPTSRQSAVKAEGSALSPTTHHGLNSAKSRPSSSYEGQGGHLATPSAKDQDEVLLCTADGRPYTLLQGTDGPDEPGRGALFPTDYKLKPNPPRYICPVRDCRRLMGSMLALSSHFRAKHCSGKFNDNLDGTLSLVATYKNTNTGSPAIIVSRNPLTSDAPPAAEPSLPIITSGQQKRRLKLSLPVQPVQPPGARPTRVPTPLITSHSAALAPKDGLPGDACRYLHGFLSREQTIPARDDVQHMMHLPLRRSLPQSWVKQHRGERLAVPVYAASLAYLVGDEITGLDACTRRHPYGGRLSLPCIALPSSMPELSRLAFGSMPTCIGCFYCSAMQRQKNKCKWLMEASSEASLGEAASAKTEPGSEEEDGEKPATGSPRAPSLARTRSLSLKRPASDVTVGPAPKAAKASMGPGERPEAMMEVELWEMAPGRLTEESGTENVAFSGAYLTSAQPIPILPDIGLHVVVAKPGSSKRWGAETSKLRVCTVAAGKVRVKVGETSFLVGPNGAFHIKPGQSCLVENHFYFDAAIHCFSVNDYELVPEEP